MSYQNIFFKELEKKIIKHGGLYNAHAHIDRFATNDQRFLKGTINNPATASLKEKQSLTGKLHSGEAYTKESLTKRMKLFLKESAKVGIKRVDSFIDVATDIPLEGGMGAINVALKLKEELKEEVEFRIGAYPIFGFTDKNSERWELFLKAVEVADFIGTLPERDDPKFYGADSSHIGFEEHFKKTLRVAMEKDKQIFYHLDQQNNPNESGTETLIDAIKWSDFSDEIKRKGEKEPVVWAVHSISPSAYSQERFEKLLDGLQEYNVGIVCCPSAALSMRQLSKYSAPIHNSIGNLLPMLERGIPVRIGTDNVDDMFLPTTTLNLRDEIGNHLSNAIRYYDPSILAKLGCGKLLDADDIHSIKEHLELEREFISKLP